MSYEKHLEIDENNLSQAMSDQPGLYAHYARLAVLATHEYDEEKAYCATLEAQVEAEIRQRYKTLGEKTTEKAIQAELAMEPRVQGARKQVREKKLQANLAKVATESFSQRMSALISMGAMQRAEIKGLEPLIREDSIPRSAPKTFSSVNGVDAIRTKSAATRDKNKNFFSR